MYHCVFLCYFYIRGRICFSITNMSYIYIHTNFDSLMYTHFLCFFIDIPNSIKHCVKECDDFLFFRRRTCDI